MVVLSDCKSICLATIAGLSIAFRSCCCGSHCHCNMHRSISKIIMSHDEIESGEVQARVTQNVTPTGVLFALFCAPVSHFIWFLVCGVPRGD